ncbi:MAG: hypothetical protein KIT62_05465 [Cyclobacteriaceae bacterium]|nr:hypothetical protein [Cyclobacteriaceae bacterium]
MKLRVMLSISGLIILAFACTPKPAENTTGPGKPETSAEATFSPQMLEGEWHMITEVDGEWVLYYPCESDNAFLQIKGDSIMIGWGQDITAGKIENWSTDGDKLTLAVNDSYSVNTYPVKTGQNGYIEWWLWEDAEEPSRFIPAAQKSQYKEVRQPCKECWDDCEEE